MQRIKDLAERTKIDLSAREEVPFNIPFITMTAQGQPLNIEMKFTRKLLEQLTSHLVDRTLQIVARVLVDSGLSTKDIDEVMLVGGQTRMPIVQDRLTKFFGKPPSQGRAPGRGGGHRRGALRALAARTTRTCSSSCWT